MALTSASSSKALRMRAVVRTSGAITEVDWAAIRSQRAARVLRNAWGGRAPRPAPLFCRATLGVLPGLRCARATED